MPQFFFYWPPYRVQKVEDHGLTTEEVEEVVQSPVETGFSRKSGLPLARGYTSTGRWIVCIYRMSDAVTVEVITAFEPEEA